MIKWEPNNTTKQTKGKLEECHVQNSKIDETKHTNYLYFPGQVLCFSSPRPGIHHATLKYCDYDFKKGSVFSTLWQQEYVYLLRGKRKLSICHINMAAMIGLVLIIPISKFQDTYHQIWDHDLWAKNSAYTDIYRDNIDKIISITIFIYSMKFYFLFHFFKGI